MSNDSVSTRHRRVAPVSREDCPFAVVAELLGQRWTMLIVRELLYGVDRFDDIQADLGMSRSTLAERLGRLERAGVIDRQPYQEPGRRRRDRYSLTEAGRQLSTSVWALTEWSERHLLGRPAPARMVQASTGHPIRVRLVDDAERPVDAHDVTWRIETT